jgi:hypothetical protein
MHENSTTRVAPATIAERSRLHSAGMRSRDVPLALRYATMIAAALAVVGVLRVVLTFALFDDLIDAYVRSKGATALPREMVEDGAPGYKAIALAFGLGLGTLVWLLTRAVRDGVRWARIPAAACGVLVAFGGFTTLAQPSLVILRVLGVLTLLGGVAVIVALFQRASSAFLTDARA